MLMLVLNVEKVLRTSKTIQFHMALYDYSKIAAPDGTPPT
jgi:hypothetical protein